jgi:hypothetical protein
LTKEGSKEAAVAAIAVSRKVDDKPQAAFAGTSDSLVWATLDLTKEKWVEIIKGLPPRAVTQLAVDPSDSATIYVTFGGFSQFPGGDKLGHVFTTKLTAPLEKTEWTGISGKKDKQGLPDFPVNDIVIDPVLKKLYVVTDIGVYVSSYAGGIWNVLGAGLPRVAVRSLKLDPDSRTLRAGTYGLSAWDMMLSKKSGNIELDPPVVDFGEQTARFTSPARSILLENTGNRAVHIFGMQTTDNFAYSTTCGSWLEAGQSCAIAMTFYPPDAGVFSGDLVLVTDDIGNPHTVSLTGQGR